MREVEIVYGDKLIPVQLPEPVLTSAAEYGAEKVAAISDIRQALKNECLFGRKSDQQPPVAEPSTRD